MTFAPAPLVAPPAPDRTLGEKLLWIAYGPVMVVILVSFVLSFRSQMDLAIAARFEPDLAWGLPTVIDGTILVSTHAAVILRKARWYIAGYPWLVLAVFGSMSVWSNGMHATGAAIAQHELFVVGAVPSVGLLASTHLLVVMLGHTRPPIALASAFSESRPVGGPQQLAVVTPITTPSTGRRVAASAATRPAGSPSLAPLPDKVAGGKSLTRTEVVEQVDIILGRGGSVSGSDVAVWMGLSESRGTAILNQILAVRTAGQT